MRKLYILLIIFLLLLTGCKADGFKESYESLNNTLDSEGLPYRSVTITNKHLFTQIDAQKALEMLENEESGYFYFGYSSCPWCRSVIEKCIETATNKGIKKIYYVDIKDIRDELKEENGEIVITKQGSEEYYRLLELLDGVLMDYLGEEKRIYAPNFIYVENGNPVRLVTGISDKQKDSHSELTKEILNDEEVIFAGFFIK